MSDPRDPIDTLAALVADGTPVDWDAALRNASNDAERRVVHQLQIVSDVARVHRSGGQAAAPDAELTIEESTQPLCRFDPLPPGATWAHLELREKLGEGAFGEVYRAWDRRLDREVALKLLKSGASTVLDEGRLLAKLRHSNVVTVYGAEVHDGRVGLWMEFIRGRSLEQLLNDQGPFGAREAALIGIDLCKALAAVHRAGVIHRDVKAQNAMRESGGRILLTDFGAGVELRGDAAEKASSLSGTPRYMASELFNGEAATERSDIYSLGVVLYHLVTGSFPIDASTWSELHDKHARREAKLLRDQRPDLPEGFVKVVERALAWDPTERFATAGQMEQALSNALGIESGTSVADAEPLPPRKRGFQLGFRWGPIQISIAGGLVIAGVALLNTQRLFQTREPEPERALPKFEVPTAAAERAPLATWPSPIPPPRASAAAPYTVEAALYRVAANSAERERLEPGARLALGDALTLEFKASAPLHVYVINEDEAGHSYALFPLPGLDPQNPLPPGEAHVLPGTRDGKSLSWKVDSAGGREHLMILASPNRLVEFEAEMNALARAGETAVSIPETAKLRLRGIGGLAVSPAANGRKSAGHLFDMAQRLASRSEIVKGVWMRRIELENPRAR